MRNRTSDFERATSDIEVNAEYPRIFSSIFDVGRSKFDVRIYFCLCITLISIWNGRCLAAEPTTQPLDSFVRFQEDGHGGGVMQAAVGRYVNDDGVQLDLLSTMHIGEESFFRDLAHQFPKYDAVLYELVAKRGEPADEEGVNDQQLRIAHDCKLENQGPHMTYDRENFIHADLSLEDIEKLEIARHGMFTGALGDGPGIKAARDERDTAGQRQIYDDIQAAKAATGNEKYRLMRRAYSRLLVITAQPAPGKTYPPDMEVLVGARNDKVMSTLVEQIAAGKKKLAIFYGAAHMVDLEHRIVQMGFTRQSVSWKTAWTVAPDRPPTIMQMKSEH